MTDFEALEQLVDRLGYAKTLDWLADIATDKAAHIRTNWQDERLARRWEGASKPVRTTARGVAREYAI